VPFTVEKRDCIFCTSEANFSKEDFIRAYDQAIRFSDFMPGDPILFDFRSATLVDLSYEDCNAIAKHELERSEERGGGRCALTVNRDVDYGVARIVQALRECNIDETQVRVFRDLDEAKDWLLG
jgi:hypothetical protein